MEVTRGAGGAGGAGTRGEGMDAGGLKEDEEIGAGGGASGAGVLYTRGIVTFPGYPSFLKFSSCSEEKC